MVDAKGIHVKRGRKQFWGTSTNPTPVGVAWNSKCCVCTRFCYRTIMVICIYDESNANYYNPGGDRYGNYYREDLERWNGWIENNRCTTNIIRLGLIIPSTSEIQVKHPQFPWPLDTVVDEIEHTAVGSKSPRVSEDDIMSMFYSLKGDGDAPELLLFCLDNSGSITLPQYATQLRDAKILLGQLYPNMVILDDISTSDERWIRDAYNGASNRLCKKWCLCDMCDVRPSSITVWLPPTTPGALNSWWPGYGPFGKSYILTPYGESDESQCRWRHISKVTIIYDSPWIPGTPTPFYSYEYVVVNAYITKYVRDPGDGNLIYEYIQFISLEILTSKPVGRTLWDWQYSFSSSLDKLPCLTPAMIPFNTGDGTPWAGWTPSA